jgi:hypothetical protein
MKSSIAYSSQAFYKLPMKLFLTSIATSLFIVTSFESGAVANDLTSVQPSYVVELFTSQGCSSCPPANKFVSKLAQSEEDALVLSYGVTYWDYLGWKDTFGDPVFTERQRQYGKVFGATIYTPQIVLNGSAHSPRYSKSDVISMPLPKPMPEVFLSYQNGILTIASDTSSKHTLSLVRFKPGLQEVKVKRGENGGRTLKVENVVTDIRDLAWNGTPLRLTTDMPEGETFAALFHAPETSKVVTAAVLK